jgi:hypothetical protein
MRKILDRLSLSDIDMCFFLGLSGPLIDLSSGLTLCANLDQEWRAKEITRDVRPPSECVPMHGIAADRINVRRRLDGFTLNS